MTAAVFTKVDVHSSEGETSKMFNLNSSTLYEIRTVLDITTEDDLPDDFQRPQLVVHSLKEKLAIGVGPALHIMRITPDIRCDQTLTFPSDVCAVRFLVDGRLLIVVLDDGSVVFVNTFKSDGQQRTRKLLSSCSVGATINEYMKEHSLLLIITDSNGNSNVIELPKFDRVAECDPRVLDDHLIDLVNATKFISDAKLSSSLTSFMSASELVSFSSTPGTSSSLSFDNDSFLESSDFMDNPLGFKYVQKVGFYTVCLTENGMLHFYDDCTGQLVKEVDLRDDKNFDDEILSFEFLDAKGNEENLESLKLLLIVKTKNDRHEVQIRRFSDNFIEYRVQTSKSVIMLPDSAGEDNYIILIDPFNRKNDEAIQLRFINEAYPEIRFEKLIACGRFDDAEEFAKQYGLDIEKVHIKRAFELINEFGEDDETNVKLMDHILSYCEKITDHNAVGDICNDAITVFPTYECISRLLTYALKRNITDQDILCLLTRRRYDLLTFAAIADCDKVFNADAWAAMVHEEDAVYNMFESSWATGEVTAGRVFWNRYSRQIQEHLISSEKVVYMIDNLQSFVLDQPQFLNDVIEFMQHDFGPFYLTLNDDLIELQSRSNTLVEFITNVAVGLERVDPDNFPKNSLFACEMLERMLDILRLEKTTPAHQKLLYNIFGILGPSTSDSDTAVGKLSTRTDNLRKMLRLKDSYQCKIAYNQYIGHTVESICFLILDRCKTIQTVPKHIQKVALPYMKEHGLKKDATLLEYIKKVSDRGANAETNQQNNPWDDLCICFAESIDNILYRCQAIIKIAKRSSTPWSNRLRKAVNEMFKAKGISAELRRDLNIQCQTEELSNLMIEYDISLTYLTRSFNQTSVMELLARAFYTSKKPLPEKMEQLYRMAQLFEIISQKDIDVDYTVAQAVAIAANIHIRNSEIAPISEAFAAIKAEHCRKAAAETLVSMCTGILELCGPSMVEARLAAIDTCSIVARTYLPSTSSIKETLDISNRLLHLQKTYGLLIPYSELTNRGKNAVETRLVQYIVGAPTKSFDEIIRLGQLLAIKKETICELYLHNNDPTPEMYDAALSLISESADELDKSALDTSINYIRQMLFIFHQYASDRHRAFRSEHATYIIEFFRRLSPSLIKLTETALQLELPSVADLLFSVQEFITLFDQTLKCLTEMPGDADRSLTVSFSSENVVKESSKIYEMSHRWGVLNPANVGLIFDSVEVIKALSRVAYSMFMKENGDDTLLDVTMTDGSMPNFWDDVFICYNGNPYLKMIAYNFAFKLPCFKQLMPDQHIAKSHIVEMCQKILVAEKIDLQLAVSLVFCLPDDALVKVVTDLFSWATKKQNSRAVFYVSRVAQMVTFVLKENHARNSIYESYRGAWWSRRLVQEGITALNINDPSAVHAVFVSNIGSPLLYKEYCEAYKLDANEQLLSYAFDLLRSSAHERDLTRFEHILDTASAIFQMAECHPETLCKRSFEIIEYLCPYNYKALSLLISYMCQWSSSCEIDVLNDRAEEYRLLLIFLTSVAERKNDYTLQETRWYLERQKHRYEQASNASDSMDFEMETDHDLLNVDERQNVLEKNYPPLARKHLPFHVFLLQSQEDYERLIGPVLSNELDIHSVFGWLQLLEKTEYICKPIGRTVLVTTAISNKVHEVVSQQSELNEDDIKTIETLLVSVKVKINMLRKLATQINKLPLCMAKVRVLALVRNVGNHWLNTSKDVSKEREAIFDFVHILNNVLKKYECEFILDQYCVVVVEKTLYEDGAALVQHIFAEHIDWNDRRDIQRKMTLSREITRIYEITLDDSLMEIVGNWLKGGESVVGYLKPVITGQLNQMTSLDSCDNLFPPLPYNDVDVVRMAYILTELNSQEMNRRVAQHLLVSDNESIANLLQRLRILCVFIRFLNNQGFTQCFSHSITGFAEQLFSMILSFAFKVCQVDCKLADYLKVPAHQFVSSLVNAQSGVKQSLETFQLAAVSIIDRGVDDSVLIERTLKRLMQYKCAPYISMLLNYSVRLSNIQFTNSLPRYFNIVSDAFWESLSKGENVVDHQYRDLVYFLLSCPTEGGNEFKRLIQTLEKHELVVARRLIAASSGFTASKFGGIVARSSKDIPQINPNAMNNLGSMMRNLIESGEETQASYDDDDTVSMEE